MDHPVEELAYRLRQQQILADFGLHALRSQDLDALLQRATELCAEGMAATLCKVMEWQPVENRLLVRAGVGWAAGLVGRATAGADLESPAGYALRTGTPVISSHLEGETRFRTPHMLAEHGVRRAINVPIQAAGGSAPFGILEVDSRDPGRFEEADLGFMQGLANLLGFAIERWRAERTLRGAHEHTVEILESISDAFYAVDREWRFTYLNRKAEEWWGRRREDLIGKIYWDEFPQAVGSEAYQAHQVAMRERRPVRLETVSPILGHWVDIDIHPTASGGLSVYFRDVTARKHDEGALRASEQRLRLALDAGKLGEWELDVETDTSVRALRHDQIFGYHEAVPDWGFKTFIGHVLHEDRDRVESAFKTAAERGTGWHFECRIRRADDGEVRWIAAHGEPQLDGNGRVVRLFGIVGDVTDQRRTEEALRDLTDTLERRVEERTAERDRVWRNSRDLLVVVGSDGVFRAVNPAWTTILGHDPEEVVGHSFLEFVWTDDADVTQRALDDATARRDLTNFENRYRHKDGTPRWISWHTSVEGDLVFAYGRHVTLEKEQAAALRQTEEALRQSQKMEAVGQLTGGVAHDFNNLLQMIGGSLEAVEARLAAGRTDVGTFTAAASHSVDKAATLTQRLLAFSRRQPLNPTPLDLNVLVMDMQDLVRRSVGEAVTVETVLADELWRTWADANQVESVLLNLAINARDALPDGGRLTIETANVRLDKAYAALEPEAEPGDYAMLAVTDTGCGMAPDVLARAFEPFFTTKPVGQGTGLGLSQLYGFAKQSRGHARLYSEPGKGTSVKLYLPRYHGTLEEADIIPAIQPISEPSRSETVLIVEDEVLIAMLMTEALGERGYSVLEAAEGQSALRILEGPEPIDLMVTDVGLPGIDGRQLAKKAREIRPGLKVLFLTGYAHNAAIGEEGLGPDTDLLSKPVAMQALLIKVRCMIEGSC